MAFFFAGQESRVVVGAKFEEDLLSGRGQKAVKGAGSIGSRGPVPAREGTEDTIEGN